MKCVGEIGAAYQRGGGPRRVRCVDGFLVIVDEYQTQRFGLDRCVIGRLVDPFDRGRDTLLDMLNTARLGCIVFKQTVFKQAIFKQIVIASIVVVVRRCVGSDL